VFVSYFKILLREEQEFLNAQTKERFDLDAFKLMGKASYDFNNPNSVQNVKKDPEARGPSRSLKSWS